MSISLERRNLPECTPPSPPALASSHLVNPSNTMVSDDVHVQLYQEVCSSTDLLQILDEVDIRIESKVLADKFGNDKKFLEKAIKLLSISKDAIDRLDEEKCHRLLKSVKEVVAHLRSRIIGPLEEVQPWPSKVYLQDKESSPFTNPSKEALSNNWNDHLYLEVKYMNYMYSRILVDEHMRVECLISKGEESAKNLGSLKSFLEKSLNLMSLQRADVARANKKECRRLVKMTKLFVICKLIKDYANERQKHVWPLQNLSAISELLQQQNLNSISDQVEPESSYFNGSRRDVRSSEGDWHEQAYKELLSMRILYSSQLDDAYIKHYMGRVCNMLSAALDKFLLKSLEFLATSRAEMVFLSKEKCCYRMMLINFFVVLTSDTVYGNWNLLQPQASGSLRVALENLKIEPNNSARHIPLESWPNWRDLIYEELRAIRKKFSSVLDEAYIKECGESTQNPNLAKKRKACEKTFLDESLQFLAAARADLALAAKEDCCDRLRCIRGFLNLPTEFVSAEQHEKFVKSLCDSTHEVKPESHRYWRNEVYEEIKSKETKLQYGVEAACKKVYKLTYQNPEVELDLEELRASYDQVWKFYKMPRCEMALFSKEEMYGMVALVNRNLRRVEEILNRLQVSIGKRIGFPCDFNGIKLKQRKCCSRECMYAVDS